MMKLNLNLLLKLSFKLSLASLAVPNAEDPIPRFKEKLRLNNKILSIERTVKVF